MTPGGATAMAEPISIAILNDYRLAVAEAGRRLHPYAERVRTVAVATGSEPIGVAVDIAVYDTFGKVRLDVARISELVADSSVGRVAVYASSLAANTVPRLLDVGVAGCLAKSLSPVDLVRSLERVHRGEVTVAMRGGSGPPGFASNLGLSYRESEVLALLSQGLRNQAIARALNVGDETVKSHLKSIYRKLGLSSRGEAIARALRDPSFAEPERVPGPNRDAT